MKLKMLIIATAAIFIQSCATLNPTIKLLDPRLGKLATDGKLEGKKPKEVQKMLGNPMSVGWMDRSERGPVLYYMTYALGEGETSFLSFSSTADRRQCLVLYFWENDSFKIKQDQSSNSGTAINSCAFQNGKPTYDDSLIEPIKNEEKK